MTLLAGLSAPPAARLASGQDLDPAGNRVVTLPRALDTATASEASQQEAPQAPLELPSPDVLRGLALRDGKLWGVTAAGFGGSGSGQLYGLDPGTGKQLSTLTIRPRPTFSFGLAYDSSSDRFLVTDPADDLLLLVDPDTGAVLESHGAPAGGPVGAAYDGKRDAYWIADWTTESLHCIEADTLESCSDNAGNSVSSIAVPAGASRIAGAAYDAIHDAILFHSRDSAETYLLGLPDGSVLDVFPTPGSPASPGPDCGCGQGAAWAAVTSTETCESGSSSSDGRSFTATTPEPFVTVQVLKSGPISSPAPISGSSTNTNACLNESTEAYTDVPITMGGTGWPDPIVLAPKASITLSHLSFELEVDGARFVELYNLGFLSAGSNSIVIRAQVTVLASNTWERSQTVEVTFHETTVVSDPDGERNSDDEEATPLVIDDPLPDTTWKPVGGNVEFAQGQVVVELLVVITKYSTHFEVEGTELQESRTIFVVVPEPSVDLLVVAALGLTGTLARRPRRAPGRMPRAVA